MASLQPQRQSSKAFLALYEKIFGRIFKITSKRALSRNKINGYKGKQVTGKTSHVEMSNY
jgi:hypothetical protein